MSLMTVAVLSILLLFILFLMGVEIGFAMALTGFIGYAVVVNLQAAMKLVATDIYSVFSSYSLIVIPLFVFMGQVGSGCGIARGLYDAAYKFVGHVPGGLAIGTVVAATAFKAICGSSAATAATFATIAVPEMDRYGYDKRLSCGTVATVGTLGVIIPPSVVLIIYGILTDTSIGKLFLAGIIPGVMLAVGFILTIYVWCRRNPKLGPKGARSTAKERILALPSVTWVVLIFVLVVGGLMGGFFSPTEAGSIGAFAVLILAIAKRDINRSNFVNSIKDSLRLSCMILMLVAGATVLGHFFAVTKMPYMVSEWLSILPIPRFFIVVIIIFVYLIGGSFIEDMAFLILATPIFLPIILKLGYDTVWFGIIVCVTTMIGIILPPMAINVFVVSGIAKVPIGTVYKGIYPHILIMSICLLILLLFPQISLFLPNILM